MKNLSSENSKCFVCGNENESGLKVDFKKLEDKSAYAEYIIPEKYQGYEGIIHGGIITTLLDEAMSKTIHFNSIIAVTAELTVRFKKPLPVNKKIIITASVRNIRGKLIETVSEIRTLDDNQVIASATAKFIFVK